MIRSFSLVMLFGVFFSAPSAQSDELYTRQKGASLRADPGGSLRGQLSPYVKVTTGERRGEWLHVTVDGWTRVDELSNSSPYASSTSTPTTQAQPATHAPLSSTDAAATTQVTTPESNTNTLQLLDFDVFPGNRDIRGIPDIMVIKLRVKNSTSDAIAGWSAVLVAADRGGTPLFRYKVRNDDTSLKQGEEGEVSFFWRKGQKEYEDLSTRTKDQLKVTLSQIQLESP